MKVLHQNYLRLFTINAIFLAIVAASPRAQAKPQDTVVTTVAVASWATGITVSLDDQSVYVGSIFGQLSVIATSTDTVSSSISSGGNLNYLTVSPAGGNLFATQFEPSSADSTLYDLNLTTQSTTSSLISQSGNIPALSRSGTLLYVPTSYPNIPGAVQVFNPIGLQLLNVISVGGTPHQLVFTPDGSHAYVSNQAAYLSYIDLNTGDIKATITNSAFNQPLYLAISPDGSELYIAQVESFNSKGDQKKGILFFDTKTRSVTREVSVTNSHANKANDTTYYGVPALSLDGKYLYVPIFASVDAPPGGPVTVAQGNTVAVISTSTGKMVDSITVGGSPWQVAIGDAQRAYVSNYADGTVTVIDISE